MSKQNGKWLVAGSVELNKLSAAVQAEINDVTNKLDASEVGVSVASLVAGKVPVSQLPNAIMEYKGVWSAATNTPTLENGAGNDDTAIGDVYRVSAAGTVDFGAGDISFEVGDYVILNSSKVFEKADMSDGVVSVNGATGIVVLDADDIDDASTTHKFASAAQLDKVDFLTVTQAVDLDQLETDSHTHANKAILDATTASFLTAQETKLGHISVTQAVDLDTIESDLAGHLDGGANKHDASEIDVEAAANYLTVADLATNLTALDTQIKANADAIGAIADPIWVTQEFVLAAQDITNEYVTLSNAPIAASVLVYVDGGPIQRVAVDYSITGTQLDFLGDLLALLAAGDILFVKYQY